MYLLFLLDSFFSFLLLKPTRWKASPLEFGAALVIARFVYIYCTETVHYGLCTEWHITTQTDTVPRLSPILEPFVDPTRGTTRILTGDSHDRKPGPEPPPGLSRHLKLNSDTTELTLVECVRTRIQDLTLISPILDRAYEALSNKTHNPLLNRVDTSTGVVTPPKTIETKGITSPNWTRPSLRSGQSPDSTASSLTGMVWKPGHHMQRDYSDTQTSEARSGTTPSKNPTGIGSGLHTT
ncbi:hypothetical protein BS47DRAFT_1361526 [Hydnum rufescens UP504]|uniref:Uncharacterized protein n=1 Tax=Hydnum rufescens UP504 TaxID=1448309 RepID=A0A9P6DTU1_9AGAM|nr:hypothetical protein BS47DRAFT_1361526 [Hydnum rufescens UP504]